MSLTRIFPSITRITEVVGSTKSPTLELMISWLDCPSTYCRTGLSVSVTMDSSLPATEGFSAVSSCSWMCHLYRKWERRDHTLKYAMRRDGTSDSVRPAVASASSWESSSLSQGHHPSSSGIWRINCGCLRNVILRGQIHCVLICRKHHILLHHWPVLRSGHRPYILYREVIRQIFQTREVTCFLITMLKPASFPIIITLLRKSNQLLHICFAETKPISLFWVIIVIIIIVIYSTACTTLKTFLILHGE